MMVYVRLKGLCALHAEWGRELTASPLFSWQPCNGEIILDMPYCRVIYTPAKKIVTEPEIDGKPSQRILASAARTAKD